MTGIIILAAGESKRLGQPKQNLIFQGKTLLQHAINTALASECSPVMVVLGAHSDTIAPAIQQQNITLIQNPNWSEGMASSIRMAINQMITLEADSAIIMLCDQPFVNVKLIGSVLQKHQETGKAIVACSYNNTVGVPVLFDKSLFPALLLLQGQEGAKKILAAHAGDIVSIAFEKGSVDIDTLGDYEGLIVATL